MRREVGARLPATDVVAAAEERAARESQTSAAGNARAWLADTLASSKRTSGRVDAAEPNQIWQSDMTKIWAGPAVG